MICPYCDGFQTKVLDSRPVEDGKVIRRRRECESCGGRFTTYERYERMPFFVVKKDGRKERFNRTKLRDGILKAFEKRPFSLEEIDKVVSEIENQILKSGKHEIEAAKIGEITVDKLKNLDQIAYVRFASVYKEFRDLDHFMDIINELKIELKNR
jgi:transcriptional repressor NrdR